jgi:type II secretory pathway component PulM
MEWAVLLVLAAIAVALIVLPSRGRDGERPTVQAEQAALLEERRGLYAELHELDEDMAAGRIAAEDRALGRRALAPRLRAVTEALRAHGIDEGRE